MKTNMIYRMSMVIMACFAMVLTSCKPTNDPKNLKDVTLRGQIQKGPFVSGSTLSVYELDDALAQTGKTYVTTIDDNFGNFELQTVSLSSPYVMLKADGFYFNEITGDMSSAPLTLYAISDIFNATTVNVNVLTTIEYRRVCHLVQKEGVDFSEAIEQARTEVYAAFGMDDADMALSDLNLSNNAALMAISCLVQGPGSTAKTIELLADIARDMAENGQIDDASVGQRLAYNALRIKPEQSVSYIESLLGETLPYSATDVEDCIDSFLEETGYTSTSQPINYPEWVSGMHNVLAAKDGDVFSGKEACMAVNADSNCPVRWTFRSVNGHSEWYYDINPQNIQVVETQRNGDCVSVQTFMVIEPGKAAYDYLQCNGLVHVDIYEFNSDTPTRSFTVSFPNEYY